MKWVAILIILFSLFILDSEKMLALFGLITIIVLFSYVYHFHTKDNLKKEKEKEKVILKVNFNQKLCSKSYPLYVTIYNKSHRFVDKVTWNIAVQKPGSSTDFAKEHHNPEYNPIEHQYKNLKSKGRWSECDRIPKLKKNIKDLSALRYSIKNKKVTFK